MMRKTSQQMNYLLVLNGGMVHSMMMTILTNSHPQVLMKIHIIIHSLMNTSQMFS